MALSVFLVSHLLLAAGAVHAQAPSRLVRLAKGYAKARNYPVRAVAAGPAAAKVNRVFVPILAADHAPFQETFTEKNGAVILRYAAEHLSMAVKPGDVYLWARNSGSPVYGDHSGGGYSAAVDLAGELPHLTQWLGARQDPQDKLFCSGNCMEWLTNAEVAPGTPLFHLLGLKRSKDGPTMKAKLIHGANQRVEVVGVHVKSLDEFNAKTDQDLLGPPPPMGVEDAVK